MKLAGSKRRGGTRGKEAKPDQAEVPGTQRVCVQVPQEEQRSQFEKKQHPEQQVEELPEMNRQVEKENGRSRSDRRRNVRQQNSRTESREQEERVAEVYAQQVLPAQHAAA